MPLRDLFKGSKSTLALPHPSQQPPLGATVASQGSFLSSPTGYYSQYNDPPRVNAFAQAYSPADSPYCYYPQMQDSNDQDTSVRKEVNSPAAKNGNTKVQQEDVPPSRTSEGPKLAADDPKDPGVSRSRSERFNKRLKPLPPASVVVDPFGGLKSPTAVTPVQQKFETPATSESTANDKNDVSKKPTCSLNLVCYSKGCAMSQIRVTTRARFDNEDEFKKVMARNPKLIATDEEFFEALRDRYLNDMCGFWRRYFSLKTLRRLRLLSYTQDTRPTAVPLDEFTMQEVLYAYNHPSEFSTETDWIEWVFRLRQPDKRHALEFVEGWNGTRISIVGSMPCVASTLVGVIWSARGGDVQTAFTVAGFILTVATVLLALLAVISGIDSRSQ